MIQDKIDSLTQELASLRHKQKESFNSVLKEVEGAYFNSFKEECHKVLCLISGETYRPFDSRYNLHRGKVWKTETYLDYFDIYNKEGFGKPIGFIALESGLFEATERYHHSMWVTAIKDSFKKEFRSFEDFKENLKSDLKFLKDKFEEAVKETGSGAYSCKPYIEVYENKKLKLEKHYIYFEETSRRL
jgi:hypothetical protein